MTLPLNSGRVEVFKPTNTSTTPDLVLEPPDLRQVTVTQEVQDAAGTASIKLKNTQGKYASEITSGDRLEFVVELGGTGTSSSTKYGGGSYGGGTYGLRKGAIRRWTGMASIPRYSNDGEGTRMISFDAQPFAFGVMGGLGKKVDNAFRNRTVTHIAKTIIEDEAAVLDTSGIDTFDTTYDVEFDGTPLLKAISELADVVNAVFAADGKTVILTKTENIPIQWTATADDFEGGWNVDPVDDEVWNQVRVEGGSDNDVGDSQLTQSGYTTVTESSRITHRLNLPKSRIDQIDLWTRTTGSQENVVVRIQEDIGGVPSDVNDQTKDLVNKELSHEFLSDDDFTTFLMEPAILPDPEPWLIIESSGTSGQDIGVDGSGNPAYKAYYFYPIITQRRNQESIDEYRRREHRIERENITTAKAALDLVEATLRHHNKPRREFSTSAGSLRAHRLNPINAVHLEFEEETAVGDYMVTSRSDTYAPDGARNQLETELRLQEIATF